MTTVSGTNYTPYNSSSSDQVNNDKTIMQDDFLKLMVAQLKNQDPLSPVDDSQFLAQLAQFSALEQMSNVARSVEQLNQNMTSLYSQSLLTQGAAMIGKEAVGIGSDGQEISGVISSVKWSGDGLQIIIGEEAISMENISEIREAGSIVQQEESDEEITTSAGSDDTNSDNQADAIDTDNTTEEV